MYGELPTWNFKLWPTSTSVIMASLFLALGFTVNMQITERIDTIMWGGAAPLFGVMFLGMWMTAGALYGIPGALIVANINPIVANLTATNPLAPTFFANNMLYAVPMALFIWYFKDPDGGITFKQLAIAHAVCIPLGFLPVSLVQFIVLEFTLPVIAMWFGAALVSGFIGLFIMYPFVKRLLTAGVVQVN
jgi:hypothetical protein